MSLRRSVAAAVAVATVSLAPAARATPWMLQPGEYYSELSGSFFSTRTFFQDGDQRVGLGGNLQQRAVHSHNEFGWKKRASVWIDVPVVSRTFVPDGGGSATSTGLGDLDLGVRIGMHAGRAPLALELGWTAPLGANRTLFPGTSGSGGLDGTRVPARSRELLSDSTLFFSQGLESLSARLDLAGTIGKSTYFTLGGGYRTSYLTIGARAQADDWADFATGQASLGFWCRKNLLVSGSFDGAWAITHGDAYDRAAGELKSKEMLAGPRFTYRVDERMDVFAGSWHTPSGRNVLHADQYYCGIAWKQTGLDRLAGALGGTKAH